MKLAVIAFACVAVLFASAAPGVDAARTLQQAPAPAPIPDSFGSLASFAASLNFSSFEAALNVSGLLDTLGDSEFTIFAPNDKAFDEFLASQNYTLLDLLDSEYLTPIMSYHVVPYILPVADMVDDAMVPTLFSGQNLTLASPVYSYSAFTVQAEESAADIIKADIAAGQSIVQVIDAVLVPSVESLEMEVYNEEITAPLQSGEEKAVIVN